MVSILMGSESDREVMQPAADMLKKFKISYDWVVISAHRSPDELHSYIKEQEQAGTRVFIAGAGGAAHLPGVIASLTTRPVIGVPVHTSKLLGLDSLLSIVNMPKGIPVATVSFGPAGAANAGILAASIFSVSDERIHALLMDYREQQRVELKEKMTQTRDSYSGE